MAKPNYQFERRQRDLAKRKKQEEKRLRKLAAKQAAAGDAEPAAATDTPGPAEPAAEGAPGTGDSNG